jgi:hypothetical protein
VDATLVVVQSVSQLTQLFKVQSGGGSAARVPDSYDIDFYLSTSYDFATAAGYILVHNEVDFNDIFIVN